ncbi:MAG: hypothetical protein IMZ52_01645 [Actinobacteria bacterium]|nr:hypothetical protein [Actinomycetota bacterium]MBE3114814.1 hypothetical protein [Actinomycetota bacterium]
MCILVTCRNCNGSVAKGKLKYTYTVKAEVIGKANKCSKCNAYSYKGSKSFSWWFCCKECMLEFFGKTTEKDYRYDWEETSYQMGKVYEDEKNQLGET